MGAAPTMRQLLGPSAFSAHPGTRVGSALSPLRISRIQALADAGYPAQWHDLLNELRQSDTYLHSLLQTRETALLSKGWALADAVKPGEKKPSARAQERAAYCREALAKTAGLERILSHLLDATYKAYSNAEILWLKDGADYYPAKLEPIDGWRFAFDDFGKLHLYDDGRLQYPGVDLSQYRYKFITHQPRVNGDVPQREGLGRLLCWYAAFRKWAWRDLMLFAELFGKPITRVSYDRSQLQDGDEDLAISIVQDLTASNRAVHPKSMDVNIEWAKSTGASGESPCSLILDKAGAEMSLATLGQQATIANVTAGLGGKGDTRDLVRRDITRADGLALGETLRESLLKSILEINFGDSEDCPYWVFNTDESADAESLLNALDKGAKLGMRVPVDYAHEITGWPRATESEETLGASQVAASQDASADPTGPTGPAQDAATGPTGPDAAA